MFKRFLLSATVIFTLVGIVTLSLPQDKGSNTKIVLGASLPLNGINKELGEEVVQGANSYFSHINSTGGIHNRKIKFVYYDDKYEPQNTLKNINKLIKKDKAFALFGFVGTPTTKVIMPIIVDTDIPFIAPYTGASFLRNKNHSNIINFRSSYKEEIEAIVDYLFTKKNITKYAIFYQNDDYGEEGYNASYEALKKRGLKLVSEGTYKRNTLSIRQALEEIKTNKPEAIIIVGAYKPSAHFIKKARLSSLKNVIFAPISFVNSDALVQELQGKTKNILFSQTVPPYNFNSKISKEYLDLLEFYYPVAKPTFASFESYLAAKAVVLALNNIDGEITRKNFLTNIKNISTEPFKEIKIAYKNTQLLNKVYLCEYINNKFNLIDWKK